MSLITDFDELADPNNFNNRENIDNFHKLMKNKNIQDKIIQDNLNAKNK